MPVKSNIQKKATPAAQKRRRTAHNLYLDAELVERANALVESGSSERSLSQLVERLIADHLASPAGKIRRKRVRLAPAATVETTRF